MTEFDFENLPTGHVRTVVFFMADDGIQVLLVRRKYPPFDNKLALPGGFVKTNSTTEERAREKVLKETGIDLADQEFLKLGRRSKYSRDPREDVVSENFLVILQGESSEIYRKDEGNENSEWYYLDEVEELSFDHGAVLCEALSCFWSFMPSKFLDRNYSTVDDKRLKYNSSKALLLEAFGPKDLDLRNPVVFFGGSFDPWHEGHEACLELCPNQNIIIVADSNPWKATQSKDKCFWGQFRDIALKFKNKPYAFFSGYYGKIDGNPTVEWLPKVNCMEKELLVGKDTFLALPDWKNSSELVKNLQKIYVTPRELHSGNIKRSLEEVTEVLRKVNPSLKIEVLNNHEYEGVSSSKLRGKV